MGLTDIIGDIDRFLTEVTEGVEALGVDISPYPIDHVCYRVATQAQYSAAKEALQQHAVLLTEAQVNGRPIASFLLSQPILFRNKEIPVIELPSPKKGAPYAPGLEHIEVVIGDLGFDEFMAQHPNIEWRTANKDHPINPDISMQVGRYTVKFHPRSLQDVIAYEKANDITNIEKN